MASTCTTGYSVIFCLPWTNLEVLLVQVNRTSMENSGNPPEFSPQWIICLSLCQLHSENTSLYYLYYFFFFCSCSTFTSVSCIWLQELTLRWLWTAVYVSTFVFHPDWTSWLALSASQQPCSCVIDILTWCPISGHELPIQSHQIRTRSNGKIHPPLISCWHHPTLVLLPGSCISCINFRGLNC